MKVRPDTGGSSEYKTKDVLNRDRYLPAIMAEKH